MISFGSTTRSFPLFLKRTDDLKEIHNQDRFRQLWGSISSGGVSLPQFVILNQVHGDRVVILEEKVTLAKNGFSFLPESDGVITSLQNTALLAMSADCLTVFLEARPSEKMDWIGVVHAGWRGTQKKIAAKAFQMIVGKSGAEAKDVKIAFGPSICAQHYAVGQEFEEYFTSSSVQKIDGQLHFDLAAENKKQLVEAGASSANIVSNKTCTVCKNESLYSFRKEKEAAGRMISFIINKGE